MERTVNSFGKGINRDVDISLQPNDSLRQAKNFRIINLEGSSFVATNIKGTEVQSQLTTGFIPLSFVVADEICFIFSHNPLTNTGEVGCFPSPIYSPNPPTLLTEQIDLNLEYTYKPLYNYKGSGSARLPFRTNLFTFKTTNNLQLEARYDYDGSYNLYFTDYDNELRVINTGLAKQENKKYKLTDRIYTDANFEDLIKLQLSSDSLLKLDYIRQDNGGELACGTYFYHIRYSFDGINKTNYLGTSFPVQVYEQRGNTIAKGSEDSRYGDTNFAFTTSENTEETFSDTINVLELSGVDTQYKYYHVTVEFVSGTDTANRVYYEINNNYEINNQSIIEFKHNGKETFTTLDDNTINQVYASFEKAKSITQNDSRLIIANVKSKETKEYYDSFANYASRVTVKHIKKDLGQLADFNYTSTDAMGVYSSFPQLDINNAGYREPFHIYYNLGYHYGEIYQFGIQFIFKDNTVSSVFRIEGRDDLDYTGVYGATNINGVYRFPTRDRQGFNGTTNTNNYHTERLEAIFPKFELPNWNTVTGNVAIDNANAYVKDNVLGIRFVRLERKRDAYMQAFMIPTFSFPLIKWGLDVAGQREVKAYFADKYQNGLGQAYQFNGLYGLSNRYWDDSDIRVVEARNSYLIDSGNNRRVVPLPLGYIEGSQGIDNSGYTYYKGRTIPLYMSEHLRDPYRYGLYSLEEMVNERSLNSILNQNGISFEVVSASYQHGINLSMPDFIAGTSNRLLYAQHNVMIPQFNLPFSGYTPSLTSGAMGSVYKGKSYFVYNNINATNNKFTSVLETETQGGIKYNEESPKSNWGVLNKTVWNTYIGLQLGSGVNANGEAIDVIGTTDLAFDNINLKEFYPVFRDITTNNRPTDTPDAIIPAVNDYINDSPNVAYLPFRYSRFNDYSQNNQHKIWIIDLFRGENGRTTTIDTFYDDRIETSFFMPITQNLLLSEIASDSYTVEGTNGDNYQGVYYRKIFYKDAIIEDYQLQGGTIMMLKTDNNFNPYARVRQLFDTNEASKMSNSSEGNRRSIFPIYANDKLSNAITPRNEVEDIDYKQRSTTIESIFKYAKTYNTTESSGYNFGGNVQANGRRVGNLFIKEPLSIQSYFPTRVYYSDKHITNSFQDNYRVIQPFSFQDYDIALGIATSVKTLNNQLYLIQENGVSLLSFNERQFVGEQDNVYINTNSILSPYQAILSREYGSQHIDSVLATDNTIYFVDVKRRAICRINGQGLEVLSDNRISSELQTRLKTYDTNSEEQSHLYIRTFYDKKYNEVIFVFVDRKEGNNYQYIFNENINAFIERDGIPELGFSIYEKYYSLSDIVTPLITYPSNVKTYQNGISRIYEHDKISQRNFFYNQSYPMYFHYIVNQNFEIQKIFDNIVLASNHILPTKLYYKITDELGNILEDEITYTNGIPTNVINTIVNKIKYIEGQARFSIAHSNKGGNTNVRRRNRDKAIEIGIYYNSDSLVTVNKVITIFRYSYS